MAIHRIYTAKKPEFSIKDSRVLEDIKVSLKVENLKGLKVYNRYDISRIDQEVLHSCLDIVFYEPIVDDIFFEIPKHDQRFFAFEYLPGQFDQKADSACQCIQFITKKDRPVVKTAKVVHLFGDISDTEFNIIKNYFINKIESREASFDEFSGFKDQKILLKDVEKVSGFINLDETGLLKLIDQLSLSMSIQDAKVCKNYFANEEKRDPSLTELKLLDTYWSDHCRHTTFNTHLNNIEIQDPIVAKTYEEYLAIRKEIYSEKEKAITLMDIATLGAKYLKSLGYLKELDVSDEINACSVKIDVEVDEKVEGWLLMFKNETHNHPTEIEPFGGAATCLGGAIRDPLSGRSYVYQAMRISGAADPINSKAISGKLPQSKICVNAAEGYSSYGNQIGVATGFVKEIYHPNYIAKRMEVGAVIGATPLKNVVREIPKKGDIIVLIGGRTGRDGCGGATGSSKVQDENSIDNCSAEVQKGNPPEERKIQRFFRNPKVSKLVKRCNDFGAGGVCVAVGELADSIEIDLDKIPKKYENLDGTELAISESQERMAVVISPLNLDEFIKEADKENIEVSSIAEVTDNSRLVMNWRGKRIVDLSRKFIELNGAPRSNGLLVKLNVFSNKSPEFKLRDITSNWIELLKDLNVCSQRGLSERFDSTIGSGTVLMPRGGRTQSSDIQAMVCKIPVLEGETSTCSLMAAGYDPYLACESSYHGAYYSVIDSVAKVVACGGDYKRCWLSFQEYFGRLSDEEERWGVPFSALMGALKAQLQLKIAAIGGKDSMSGTFKDIDVPPTLISFAVSVSKVENILSCEFKKPFSNVYLVQAKRLETGLVDEVELVESFDMVSKNITSKSIISAYAVSFGGIAEGIAKMTLGNEIGFEFDEKFDLKTLFGKNYGSFILESDSELPFGVKIGATTDKDFIAINGESLSIAKIRSSLDGVLEKIYPTKLSDFETLRQKVDKINFEHNKVYFSNNKTNKPKVLIPVFPGTNCEYDTARAFKRYPCNVDMVVIKNRNSSDIEESIASLKSKISQSQIIAIPGGFSGGDEPDGSGKFINAFFRNEVLKLEINNFLQKNDGLICGICNGFQALIKLGLLPYGEFVDPQKNKATLTFNTIGRHQSRIVKTRVASNKSPWFMHHKVGEVHHVPISHGEGRFISDSKTLETLVNLGQIVTQYVDDSGNPTMDIDYNPNQSLMAIEGIVSPDGKILGKMGHSERVGKDLYKNIGEDTQNFIFKGAIDYFSI